VVVSARTVHAVLRAFHRNRIAAAVIGQVCRKSEGIKIIEPGRRPPQPLRVPARDEIARLLEAP